MTGDLMSGLDDCGIGLLCSFLDEQGQGVCLGLCDGTASQDCTCADPDTKILFCQGCYLALCLKACRPLLQDCAEADVCTFFGDNFVCLPDLSGPAGAANDPCEFLNACDKGLYCLPAAKASNACRQTDGDCCQPFCEFVEGQKGTCPNPDQECRQWYDPQVGVPLGEENIGVCAIPP